MQTGRSAKPHVSYYEMLNVLPNDGDDAIRRAYNKLALKHHPDRNPKNLSMAQHRFNLITEAYAAIRSAERRTRYNQWLVAQELHKPTGQADNDNVQSWHNILTGLMGRKRHGQ